MLFLIVIGIIAVYLWVIGRKTDDEMACVGAVIFTLIGIIMFCVIFKAQITSEGLLNSKQEEYKAIMYKSQTTDCRDEFGLLNKEIVDEIQAWNVDVVKNKTYRKNVWINSFTPSAYDELELIDMEGMQYKTTK